MAVSCRPPHKTFNLLWGGRLARHCRDSYFHFIYLHLLILLEENPSLKPYPSEVLAISYALGTDLVVQETPLDYDDLPEVCPYTLEQGLNDEFLPE